jgi:hypothetical protein
MQCWQDIAQFQQFLACMLSQMGPYPMQGVTDGSDAKAGNIGEFIMFNSNFSFPATSQTQAISVGVLSPGDWDCHVNANTPNAVTELGFALSPVPSGFSSNMTGGLALTSGADVLNVIGSMARASLTVPTLLPFTVSSNVTGTGGAAGTGTLTFTARRMR